MVSWNEAADIKPVSYTHLDVYKRQVIMLSDKENSAVDEKTKALVEAAAMYFGKQMEDV